MQKSEIADSVSLLTGCTAILDFYTAKAVHEQKRSGLRMLYGVSLLTKDGVLFDCYLARAKHRGKRSFSRWLGRIICVLQHMAVSCC